MTKNSTAFFGFLLLMLLGLSSNAQQESPPLEQEKESWFSQTRIGISTSGFQSTLSGVRTDLPYGYGFSGSPHTVEDTYGFAIGGLMQTPVFEFLELEYGLGYFYESERINIDYINIWTAEPGSARLMIDLHYLEIPLIAKFRLFKALGNEVILAGSFNTRFSIIQNSNYQDIIFEHIGLRKRQFNNFMWNSKVALGVSNDFSRNYEILLFLSADLSPFVRENPFGFMNDLLPARNSQIGIQVNYFFKTLK
jgi:hypothetical protein